MNKIWIAGLLALLAGCSSISSQTPALSRQVGNQIQAGRTSHNMLMVAYIKEREDSVNQYMKIEWVPQYVKNFMRKMNFAKVVCEETQEHTRALEMIDILSAIQKNVEAQRAELLAPIRKMAIKLATTLNAHYDLTQRMNSAVTADVQSAVDMQDSQKEILEKYNIPTNLADPLNALTEKVKRLGN